MNVEDSPREQSQHLVKDVSPPRRQTPLNSVSRLFIWTFPVSPLGLPDAWSDVECVGEITVRLASHIPVANSTTRQGASKCLVLFSLVIPCIGICSKETG